MKLIFLISLPRSGSTLLQRILMGHPNIATCGEPWLALPLALMDKKDEAYSTYGNFSLAKSINNLHDEMEGGREGFLREAGRFVEAVYARANREGACCFLDKTPRYYKILPELKTMFPDAKFIFLTRSPLAIFGSILNYIDGRVFRLPTWRQDIVEGMPALAEAIRTKAENTVVISFEELVHDPEAIVNSLLSFLGLSTENVLLEGLSERSINRGDPHGEKTYRAISSNAVANWRNYIDSATKKRIGLAWLGKVPGDAFQAFGTTKDAELTKCRAIKCSWRPQDVAMRLVGELYFNNALNVVRWSFRRRAESRHSALY